MVNVQDVLLLNVAPVDFAWMTKFGGPGKKKKPCYQRKCFKMQIRQSTETRIAKQLKQATTSKLKVTKTPLGEIQNQNHGKS